MEECHYSECCGHAVITLTRTVVTMAKTKQVPTGKYECSGCGQTVTGSGYVVLSKKVSIDFRGGGAACGRVEMNSIAKGVIESISKSGWKCFLSPEVLVTKRDQDGRPLEVELKGFDLVRPWGWLLNYDRLVEKIARLLQKVESKEIQDAITADEIIGLVKQEEFDSTISFVGTTSAVQAGAEA